MAKQPMTPAGVTAKQQELYALSDNDLKSQASLISSDFRNWVNNNFTLDTKQAAYLTSIDARFIEHAGTVTATAVQSRLPINLIYPSPPSGPVSSKYINTSDNTHPHFDSVTGYSITGSVSFEIGYVE